MGLWSPVKSVTSALGPAGRAPAPVRNLVDRIPFLDKELFLLRDFVPRDGVVVDVGAAGGVQSLLSSRLVGPAGRVIAIEARPGSARILRGWRNLLGRDNLTVLATALGAEPGTLELQVPLVPTRTHAAGSGPATGDHGRGDGGGDPGLLDRLPSRTQVVPMTTLDLVVAGQDLDRVDLVKIDVEGAELQVLQGAAVTLERHRPVLLVEVFEPFLARQGSSPAELFAWLAARGYRAHVFGDDGLVPVDAATDDEYNYLFVPAS